MSLRNLSIFFVLSALALTATCQVRGREVKSASEFKYLVSIKTFYDSIDKISRGGGVIINEYYVLTAAHNFDVRMGCKPGGIEIVAGSKNFKADEETEGVQILKEDMMAVIRHPNWIGGDKTYDAALIWLSGKSLEMGPTVQRAPLADKNYKLESEGVTIVGWGPTENEKSPDWPHQGEMKLVSSGNCEGGVFDKSHNLCYGCTIGTCLAGPGDSGSPVVQKKGKRVTVIGIHTERIDDGPNQWGAGMDIRKIRGWISSEIGEDPQRASFFPFEKMAGAFSAAARAFGFC